MANERNLKPARAKSEAREKGRAGGKASGAARRNKRDARETAKLFLDMAAAGQLDDNLGKLNVEPGDRTNLMALIARLVLAAQSGNVQAARLVLELSGDLPNRPENSFNVNVGKDDESNIVIYIPDNGRN